MVRTDEQRDRVLTEIASRVLNIPTLAERGSDRLDFHEVSVWSLHEALRRAFAAGIEAAREAPRKVPPSGVCPRCGEDDQDRLVWDEPGETVTCQRCGTSYTVHKIN